MNGQNEIILYKPNDKVQLEVVLNEETVWLTQEQIALLFGVQRPVITKHIGNIYSCGELDEISTCSKMEQVQIEGNRTVVRKINFYNLDAILSVGYRVNSLNATMFRRWASDVLKDYLFRGYAVNQRFMQIDNAVYHIGASFKDLGKKLFAFSKMEMTANNLLKNL
jgi:hypothetical protein